MSGSNLKARLGLPSALAIVMGCMIGSGIFRKPASMAAELGSPGWMLLAWLVAGVIVLCGAFTNAEIGAMMPRTGGQYVFFERLYGKFFAFTFGWSLFAVIQTGSIASILYIFSEYFAVFVRLPRFSPEIERALVIHLPGLGNLFPLANAGVKGLTLLMLWLLTALHARHVRGGGLLQNALTGLQALTLIAIALAAFGSSQSSLANLTQSATSFPVPEGPSFLFAFAAALSGAFWAYDGWNTVSFMAGEIREPERNFPRALIWGSAAVLLLYLAANVAYLLVIPIDELAKSPLVAAEVARRLGGEWAAKATTATILVCILGTASASILSTARVFFAMARQGVFFERAGRVHERYASPAHALFLQALWTSVLIITGSFDMLSDMIMFVSWLYYAAGAFGIYVLRRREPNAPRPFRTPGYPWVPGVFVVVSSLYLGTTLVGDWARYHDGKSPVVNSLFGLAIVAVGFPLYAYFQRKARLSPESDVKS